MFNSMAGRLYQFDPCLLHFRVHTQDTALIIEGMEQPGQIVHIMRHTVYRAFFSRKLQHFLIFAQFFDQFQLCRICQQPLQQHSPQPTDA